MKVSSTTAKKQQFGGQHSCETKDSAFQEEKALSGKHNIKGILLALRYLSIEAAGAGLTELAVTLEEAERKCARHGGNNSENYLQT